MQYYTLIEAYEIMKKGGVFRFADWDKKAKPYVAFVKNNKIVISSSPEGFNVKIYRPTQEEALEKKWYQIN